MLHTFPPVNLEPHQCCRHVVHDMRQHMTAVWMHDQGLSIRRGLGLQRVSFHTICCRRWPLRVCDRLAQSVAVVTNRQHDPAQGRLDTLRSSNSEWKKNYTSKRAGKLLIWDYTTMILKPQSRHEQHCHCSFMCDLQPTSVKVPGKGNKLNIWYQKIQLK